MWKGVCVCLDINKTYTHTHTLIHKYWGYLVLYCISRQTIKHSICRQRSCRNWMFVLSLIEHTSQSIIPPLIGSVVNTALHLVRFATSSRSNLRNLRELRSHHIPAVLSPSSAVASHQRTYVWLYNIGGAKIGNIIYLRSQRFISNKKNR